MNQLFSLKFIISLLASVYCSKGWELPWWKNPLNKLETTSKPELATDINDFTNTTVVYSKFTPANSISSPEKVHEEDNKNISEEDINDLTLLIAHNYLKLPLQLFNLGHPTEHIILQKDIKNKEVNLPTLIPILQNSSDGNITFYADLGKLSIMD
uniref:Putative secreted protein n=1 Tax=Panstrongylus lignarius TaxID=156445 RepID=A0A224XZW7_9HEMI